MMDSKIKLKPFYLFKHQGYRCVINIEKMHAHTVDETTAEMLEELNIESGTALPSSIEDQLNELGLIANNEGKPSKEVKKEAVPLSDISLFLTQSCNLNCIYCYGDGGEYGGGGSLEERTAYQAVDWLIEQSGKQKKIHVGFFGGEPFLEFTMMQKVARYAQKRAKEVNKKVGFSITTNATLLDDEKIAFLEEYDVSVLISFDGPREIQDAQRPFLNGKGPNGNGSYDVILPKIKKLLEKRPKTHGHAVTTGQTDPQLIKKALQEIGFAEVSVSPASKSLFNEKSEDTSLDRDFTSILKLMEQEAEKWLQYTKKRDIQFLKKLMSKSQLYPALIGFLHNTKRRYPCGAGLGMVGVSCAGDVYLCHRFVGIKEYKMGNVFNNDLNRGKYQRSPVAYVEECNNCFARYYCAGGCKHDNASSCGSAFKPSPDMCRLKCRETELAAYIACLLTDEDCAFLAEHEIVPAKPCPLDFG
jgi:uncharacterized protein